MCEAVSSPQRDTMWFSRHVSSACLRAGLSLRGAGGDSQRTQQTAPRCGSDTAGGKRQTNKCSSDQVSVGTTRAAEPVLISNHIVIDIRSFSLLSSAVSRSKLQVPKSHKR